MSDKAVKDFSYLFGGLALVGLSRILPTAAVALSTVLLLAALFANTPEFTALINRIVGALTGEQKQFNPGSHEEFK